MTFWHTKTIEEVKDYFGVGDFGLSSEQVHASRTSHGKNILLEKKPDSLLLIFLRQFKSPLIYILFASSLIIFLIKDFTDGIIILSVLVFNSIVGTIQEGRAQNTLLSLKKFVETQAVVLRGGTEEIIPDTEIVLGDMIIIHEGDKVPADARIIESSNLSVDEASLTGESEGVYKNTDTLSLENLIPAERKNMIFKGTHILTGSCVAIVTAIGQQTLIGEISKKISRIHSEDPLKKDIAKLSKFIIIAVAIISVIIFTLGILKGIVPLEMLAIIISLGVSMIPEGLPIVLTMVLATGVWRMSKRNVLVKKLQAVESLGQANVIAVDKTGTITKNELVIEKVHVNGKTFDVEGNGYSVEGRILYNGAEASHESNLGLLLLGKISILCANAKVLLDESTGLWKVAGDPIEAALLVFGKKLGFHKEILEKTEPQIRELAIPSQTKYHAVMHKTNDGAILSVIGAPEIVLGLCSSVLEETVSELSAAKKQEIEKEIAVMAKSGLRVVAVAYKNTDGSKDDIDKLIFLGLIGMKDALRPEVKDALSRAHDAGLKVIMITGDHRFTAEAIAREAGILPSGGKVLTGEDMDSMTDTELSHALSETFVFARVTPDHKFRIIQAYKAKGDVIAMTGDGVNDAPSLVAADIGVSMGKIGTEVAKEASDIVLLDDNFGSIVSAVEEGRSIYKTIQKVILYLFSTSAGEVLVIFGALMLGLPLPILAAQIIWLNFVTDGFLDVSLAMEPKERGLLNPKYNQKRGNTLFNQLMLQRMIVMALPMAVGTLWLFSKYAPTDIEKGWTVALTLLAVFQWFNAWNCKSETESIFSKRIFANKYLIGATGIVIFLQLLAVYHPAFQKFLHTVPLSFNEWKVIVLIACSILALEEIRKMIYRYKVNKFQEA